MRSTYVQVTDRDIVIFRAMSLGVATLEMLVRLLAIYGYSLTEGSLVTRLSSLFRAHMILRRKVTLSQREGSFKIYALSPAGAKELAALAYPKGPIRTGLPHQLLTRHELKVTSVVHTLERESKAGMYKYTYTDSDGLKRERRRVHEPILDLLVTITMLNGKKHYGRIEVDLGTVPVHIMGKRLTYLSQTGSVTVLCASKTRQDILRDHCRQHHLNQVFFAGLDQFIAHGYSGTVFVSTTGEEVFLNLNS